MRAQLGDLTIMTNAKLGKLLADLGIKEAIDTTIGEDIAFHGKLVIKNGRSIAILGTVEGEIESDGTVVVGEGGVVKGTVSANVIAVAGTVDNNNGAEDAIHARVSLVLGGSARIGSKTVNYGSIEMARGCRIDGTLKFVEPPKELLQKHEQTTMLSQDASKVLPEGAPVATTSNLSPGHARPLPVITPADRGVSAATQAAVSAHGASASGHIPASLRSTSDDASLAGAPAIRQVA
jgi:cytoskeletal protein CcmA (bactofilin family)